MTASRSRLQDVWIRLAYHHQGALRWLAPLLIPLSILFRLVVIIRRRLYRSNLLASESVDAPVLSVGNLTVGGVGKTPLILSLVKLFQRHGLRPAVILRGYNRKFNEPCLVKPETFDATKVETYGDEAALIALTTQVPVGIGADRVHVAKMLLSQIECDVLLLDDAFQHLRIKRNVDLVVLDVDNPLGNGYTLPYGPLREPPSALRFASATVFNGKTEPTDAQSWLPDGISIFTGELQWTDLMRLDDWFEQQENKQLPLSHLHNQEIILVSGIGSPWKFKQRAVDENYQITEHLDFPDHHWFTEEDIAFMMQKAKRYPLLITEKDAVRLYPYIHLCCDFSATTYVVRAHWLMHHADQFGTWVRNSISASNTHSSSESVDS